ncbi:MAG: YceI family protein [Chitinophagaceae bacterium]
MKTFVFVFAFCCLLQNLSAQPLVTRSGYAGFFSETPLEDIKAENRQVNAVIDPGMKSLAFALLLKGFLFDKQLMQQHFNENFVESDKYPKSTFTGNYTGNVDLTQNGTYNIQVNGDLILHGVTKNISVPATLQVQDKKLLGYSKFYLKPTDFNIKIPALVREKIAQQIEVVIKTEFNISN